MNYYIFTDQTAAEACVTTVDAALGYPSDGIPEGGGVHAPGVTLHYGTADKHPTQNLWSYPANEVTIPLLAAMTGLPTPSVLDDSWTHVPPTRG